ncbi:hypothetical protein HYT59_02500 [Candidatus Woesebacteria bacterium]|nr:hypothetical protein [Candidatus Woesebacteria bacterium]
MKRILFLVNKIGKANSSTVKYLHKRLWPSASAEIVSYSEVEIYLKQGRAEVLVGGEDIQKFDLVYFRKGDHSSANLASSMALIFETLNVKYFDTTYKNVGPWASKLTNLVRLAVKGLPVIPSYYCDTNHVLKNANKIAELFAFPIIAKDLILQHMKGVFFLKTKEDIKQLVTKFPNVKFLFQKFVPIQEEYRVLVLRGNVAIVEKRVERNFSFKIDYMDHFADSVFVSPESVSSETNEISKAASRELNLEISGVDIIVEKDTKKIWLVEVNRGPGFRDYQHSSPEYDELALFLKKELKIN